MIKILLVAGARPNFIKIMPLIKEFNRYPHKIKYTLVHTGQHYDKEMSASFFKDLKIPKPDIFLGVGSATHGVQTAKIIEGIEKLLLKRRFDLLIIVGDVNSTVAAALAAVKLGVKIAHVEAGLRSFDRKMPEEINRILTDHMSDYLFITEDSGNRNLKREGIGPSKIFFVGDIMIDSLLINRDKISRSNILKELGLIRKKYCLVTVHRPSNVDKREDLRQLMAMLQDIGQRMKVVFPAHPRTKKMLNRYKLKLKNLLITKPLGYVDFQRLLQDAKFVITDSGGIQGEATICNLPCLTIRTTTERPITITKGTNQLTGSDSGKILNAVDKILRNRWKRAPRPPKWDGKVAERITKILLRKEEEICTRN